MNTNDVYKLSVAICCTRPNGRTGRQNINKLKKKRCINFFFFLIVDSDESNVLLLHQRTYEPVCLRHCSKSLVGYLCH